MNKPATALTYRLAITLLLALLLSQAYLLAHEIEHALSGEHNDCALCLLADHQGHALGSPSLAIAKAANEQPPATPIYHLESRHTNYFASRAPPRFLLL